MASAGAKSGILLAVVGTLLPASLAAGVFLVTRISFEAINEGPINPARGLFEFQIEVDPSFMLLGPESSAVGSAIGHTSLTAVRLNFGRYTTENVDFRCDVELHERNCRFPLTIGGAVNGVGAPHIGELGFDVVPSTNDFELGLAALFSERPSSFGYSLAGQDRLWGIALAGARFVGVRRALA